MVTSKLFKLNQAQVTDFMSDRKSEPQSTTQRTRNLRQDRIRDLEEHLAHLTQQKDLHTLALKEMYQFLCKLDANFRAENEQLRSMIKAEQERSAQLIEVTKGLWEIIEMMDDHTEESPRLVSLTQNVEDLAQFEVEITDESENKTLDRSVIDRLMPMVEAS